MGGIGSGRQWCFGRKDCTLSYPDLDIRELKKAGMLKPGMLFTWQWVRQGTVMAEVGVETEEDRLLLYYNHSRPGGHPQSECLAICLTHTPCHLGGERPWFLCPALGCGKRVAILYGAGIFACRSCHRLAYPSQREDHYRRAARKAERIRQKLGWSQSILHNQGHKPKGMHRTTYHRLTITHDNLVQTALKGLLKRLDSL